jgi:hypothetical protein
LVGYEAVVSRKTLFLAKNHHNLYCHYILMCPRGDTKVFVPLIGRCKKLLQLKLAHKLTFAEIFLFKIA